MIRRTLLIFLVINLGAIFLLIADGWFEFGKGAQGKRLQVMQRSPNWQDGGFVNSIALYNPFLERPDRWFESSDFATPKERLTFTRPDPLVFEEEAPLRVTWLGHSITLIEFGGVRFLTDPIWSDRASPYSWIGPRRWYEPPIDLEDLPNIDAVLISHDHYDHLDTATIRQLRNKAGKFVVPLGVGAHLEFWGIASNKIIELDWWQNVEIQNVTVTSTPARHASGRMLVDNDKTLWMGFALRAPSHAVYFSGDTGLFPELKDIGDRLGPFDVTLIEVGAYGADWPDWHVGPEQAVLAHNWVRGETLIPIHWGMFNLARHGWTEPVERARLAAQKAGCRLLTPQPGSSVSDDELDPVTPWWPHVPWEHVEKSSIVATGDFERSFRPGGC
ncbi:MAG: MBL fold metallo-hydrolase [Pseudomonadota bacterium]